MSAIDLLYARRRRVSREQSVFLEKYAYHGTSKANLRAIRTVGLLLKVGDNTEDEVASASPQPDQFTPGAATINQRIPPEAIKVLNPRESTALALARWSEGYARDQRLKAQVSEADWRPDPEKLATDYGFIEDSRQDHDDLGISVRFLHPKGDQLIVTSRHNLTKPITQHTGWQDRLKGASSNWSTRWEYHTIDGTKSTGYDVWGLHHHLDKCHGSRN